MAVFSIWGRLITKIWDSIKFIPWTNGVNIRCPFIYWKNMYLKGSWWSNCFSDSSSMNKEAKPYQTGKGIIGKSMILIYELVDVTILPYVNWQKLFPLINSSREGGRGGCKIYIVTGSNSKVVVHEIPIDIGKTEPNVKLSIGRSLIIAKLKHVDKEEYRACIQTKSVRKGQITNVQIRLEIWNIGDYNYDDPLLNSVKWPMLMEGPANGLIVTLVPVLVS